jgi:3D (Asp-Asp-Asp) domain-containing protein
MPARRVDIVLLSVGLLLGSAASGIARSTHKRPPEPAVTAQQGAGETQGRVQVTVGAYSPRRQETQGHPRDTASGASVRPSTVALSRDVEKALGVSFGDRVSLEGFGTYVFQDRLASHKKRRADIFMESTRAARRFGERQTSVSTLSKE